MSDDATRSAQAAKPKRDYRKNYEREPYRHGLAIGQTPKGSGSVRTMVGAFRRNLEDALLAARGQITVADACLVNLAVQWESHRLYARRLLKFESATMSAGEKLKFSQASCDAATFRNRAIAKLKLGHADGTSSLAALYAAPAHDVQPAGPREPPNAENAPVSPVRDLARGAETKSQES